MTTVVVVASNPDHCALCSGRGVMRMHVPHQSLLARVMPCPHCRKRLPIVHIRPRIDERRTA